MIDPKKLINSIINNLDNFENLSEIYSALNEVKLLSEEILEELNKLNNHLTIINKEFLENIELFKGILDFNIEQLLDNCNKLSNKINEYKRNIKKNYDNLINSDNLTYQDTKKIYKIINMIEAELYNFSEYIREFSDEINEYIDMHFIDRKYKDKITKLKKFREIIDKHYETLTIHYDTIKSTRDKYRKINSLLLQYTNTLQHRDEDYILPILTNLKARLYDGLYSISILNYITGLYSISANPVTELIFLKIGNEKPKSFSLDSLFYRYPPYEPVAIKDEKGIIGNKIWFIKPKNARFDVSSFNNYKLRAMDIIKGEIKKGYGANKLKSVELIDLLGNDVNKEIILTLNRNIKIKYGSKTLKEYYSQGKSITEIEDLYNKEIIEHKRKKSYSPTNLSYIWYCRWGKGISTDPWDIDCPFRDDCWYSKNIISNTNRKCPLWSWSRRIYPKVFAIPKRKTPNKKLEFSESFNGIIPIYGRGVLIKDEYNGIQFNLPGGMYPANIEFETPIGKELTKTNVIGIAIEKKFIETIISSLLNEEISNYSVNLFNIDVSISDIILSKCFLITSTNKGINTYPILEKDFKDIIKEYNKFKRQFKKEYKINESFARDVIKNATYILLHTLAHLLLGFLSKELEINSEDLLYLVDETDEQYRILIAENSPIGALDIIGAANNRFGSLLNMIIKFLESAHHLLKEHEKQLKSYENLILKHISILKNKDPKYIYNVKIIEELKKHYSEFLKNGLVLDLHYFNTYMQLKRGDGTGYGKYGDIIDSIVKDKTINEKLKKEINIIFTLAFPSYCIDGCTSCTMFDKGCFDGLGQSITTSKELTKLFIEIILNGEEFRGPGNTVLKNIIESLCKKELVALSPYIDEEGVRFLNELSNKKGISVKLITNKKMVEDLNKLLKESSFEIYILKSNHDKAYYIDNNILLTSTANLTLKFDSINRFKISTLKDNNSYKMILEQAEKWK